MSEPVLGTVLLGLMFLLMAVGTEIAIALGIVGIVGLLYLKGWTIGLGVVGSIAWSNAPTPGRIKRVASARSAAVRAIPAWMFSRLSMFWKARMLPSP